MTEANTATKTESAATDKNNTFKVKVPKFTPKWSRQWVIPDNVLSPDDAKVELNVSSDFPVNRPSAYIEVIQQWDEGHVPEVKVNGLKLDSSKVVKADGSTPATKFTLDNNIWNTYNQLKYHYDCKIDQTTKRTSDPLKVKRFHVQAVDNSDSKPGATNTIWDAYRTKEKSNFLASFSDETDDKALSWTFNASSTDFATFGEKMKNSYSFLYTGHGAVMCRICLGMFNCNSGAGVSDADYGTWTTCSTKDCPGDARSTHCIGGWKTKPTPSFLDGGNIADTGTVPSTPKYLVISVCCGGAFEDSLYNAYISRGTMHAIGFRKSTRCDWARDYEKSFFDTWAKTHKCDPAKISTVFNGLLSTWQSKLQPVLYGSGPDDNAADRGASDSAADSL